MVRKRNSLILRIALPFALLLALSMGAVSLYLSNYFRTSYVEMSEQNLLNETRLVADRVGISLSELPAQMDVADRVMRYSKLLNVRITIIDPTGKVLSESYTPPEEMENHLDRPEIQRAFQGVTSTEMRYSHTLQVNMLYAASPMLDQNNQVIGVARLAISLNTINNKLNMIQGTVLAAAGLTLLFSLLLAVLIASYTIQPLRQLTADVQRMSDGNLDAISGPTRKDEIGLLHQTFQQMSQQLKDQIAALASERGKLQAILENMTDGIIIVDQDGIVQIVNPAAQQLFGNGSEDGVGKSLIEVLRHHQLVELWRKSLLSGEQESVALETTPARQFVQGIATPLSKELPGLTLILLQDLTRVRRLETVRRDFVSNVSHELRTPLASLKALTETLQEGALEDPPAARRFLQRMETEIDNLTQMVHELLELSKIESNRVPLKLLPIYPCDLALPAIERMQLQAERAGLTLRMDCPSNLPQVKADPQRMAQVLINLIHNAIKFTQPGGEILVSAYQDKDKVVLFVRDTGIGIPHEVLPRIFERFYKADRSRSGGGTGLGLSIARHLVEAHGGRIWAESQVNKGSTFYLSLPLS